MRSSNVFTWIVPFFIITLLVVHGAAVPPLPAEFYGSVLIDGNPAQPGTVINAQIQGVDKGSITTTVAGFYGGPGLFDSRLKVNVSEEEYRPGDMKIIFMINGRQASQDAVFEAGSSRQLDLSSGTGAVLSQPTQNVTPMGVVPVQTVQLVASNNSSDTSASGVSTITYGLDQPRTFKSDDGLAEISFAQNSMLFSPDGQFLNAVGLRSKSVTDLPPLPGNQSLRFSGYAYEIIPSGTYFNPNGTLTLKLPPEQAYEIINAGPVIYEYLPQTAAWEPVSTTSNVFTNTINAEIFDAAIYGLYAPGTSELNNQGNVSNNDSSSLIIENQTQNISPVSTGPIQPGILPVITPQGVITPLAIITPSSPPDTGEPVLNETAGITPEPEKPGTKIQPEVRKDSGSFKIPGFGLITGFVSVIKARLNGPVLTVTGILAVLILINAGVYAVYRYWWMQRERNG